jgi:hypothetical protein
MCGYVTVLNFGVLNILFFINLIPKNDFNVILIHKTLKQFSANHLFKGILKTLSKKYIKKISELLKIRIDVDDMVRTEYFPPPNKRSQGLAESSPFLQGSSTVPSRLL